MIFVIQKFDCVQSMGTNRYYIVGAFTEGRTWRNCKGIVQHDPEGRSAKKGFFSGIEGHLKHFNRSVWSFRRVSAHLETLYPKCTLHIRKEKKKSNISKKIIRK